MPSTADVQAMETMAVLLPQNDPYRRDLEIEIYLHYKDIDTKRAKALVKTWKVRGAANSDRILRRFYREDPKFARAMVPEGWDVAQPYYELWLDLLLADWHEGDGAIAALPIAGANTSHIELQQAPGLARQLATLSESDQEALVSPLLGQVAMYDFRNDAEMLACILACANGQEETHRFQEKALWTAFSGGDDSWRKAFRRAVRAKKVTNPMARQLRILSLARCFHGFYIANKPKKVTPKFVGRWRRAQFLAAELDKMPDTTATRKLRENYKNLQKGTARHLREGAEEYLTKQKSILNR